MTGRPLLWMFLLLCAGLLCPAQGFDRKGRLIRESNEPVTIRHGKIQPLPEGLSLTLKRIGPSKKEELGVVHLWLKRTIESDDSDDEDLVEQGYVAHPAAADGDTEADRDPIESADVQKFEESGPTCRWVIRKRTGQTRYLSLLEMEFLQVPTGPYAGWELRIQEGRLLIAKPGSKAYQASDWIGPYREFDNLDDGK
ncbi:MAG: hypothetical protein ACKV0T_05390 [Planctomycetales bacterium]